MPPDATARRPVEERGMTPREVARILRVSPDRVRAWIQAGELGAIDVGERGRHRYVVLPAHLEALQQRRRAVPPPPRPAARRCRRAGYVDYYP
jgi:excisionase family DNA binding protein